MAFSATTEWEVRTTGAADNGGGFNTSSTGTDYSQQDSPQVTYTDLVIDGATNTKLTSAANPFTSAHVGNIINITSGTGFTVQRVQIVSVAAGAATCDKSCGTLGSTGGNGKLGGGLTTISAAFGLAVSYNTVWIKSGTYTLTATAEITFTVSYPAIRGYETTHGDSGAKPLITTATNSTALLKLDVGEAPWVDNLHLTNTASVRDYGIRQGTGSGKSIKVSRTIFDGCSQALGSGGGNRAFAYAVITDSQFLNSTGTAVVIDTELFMRNCYFSDSGTGHATIASRTVIERCIFARATTYGVYTSASGLRSIMITNCVFYDNGTSGVYVDGGSNTPMELAVSNSIFWSNGTYGIQLNSGLNAFTGAFATLFLNNAYGNNTTANITPSAVSTGLSAVTLTADPFTSSTNFTLNSTAGGGALCKGAGIEVAF